MTWLTLRQSRLEALLGAAVCAVILAFFIVTGSEMATAYDHLGLPGCVAQPAPKEGCWTAASAFVSQFERFSSLTGWLNMLPLLIGLIVAASTVLELDQGTYRLAWMQSITRQRWVAMKLALAIAGASIVAGGLVALASWWREPFNALQGRFAPDAFDLIGIVPVAYALFALALFLFWGALLRRIVPALVLTIAGFVGSRLVVENVVRPHLLMPVTLVWDTTAPSPRAAYTKFTSGDWVINEGYVDRAGHALASDSPPISGCFAQATQANGDKGQLVACLHDHGIMNTLVYQPAHRFWLFQGIESALFIGVAALLLGLSAWWIFHRVT